MPRDLTPAIIAFPHALQKGALILLPRPVPAKGKAAGAAPGASTTGTQLRFQYNPETVTRARSGAWEARKTQKGSSKGSGGPTAPQNQTLEAFQGGGLYAKSETLSIKLVFDASELLLTAGPSAGGTPAPDDDRSLGILPELAVLERMAIANPRADESKEAGTKPAGKDTKLDAVVPSELLLVLGVRAFPVIITSMTITEKRFSPTLVPLRAEIDLQMQLLESHEVEGNQPIKAAYEQLRKQREDNAAKASQSVTVGNDGKLDAINQALSQKFEAGGA